MTMMVTLKVAQPPHQKGANVAVPDELGAELMRMGIAERASVQPYQKAVMQPEPPPKLTATVDMKNRYQRRG